MKSKRIGVILFLGVLKGFHFLSFIEIYISINSVELSGRGIYLLTAMMEMLTTFNNHRLPIKILFWKIHVDIIMKLRLSERLSKFQAIHTLPFLTVWYWRRCHKRSKYLHLISSKFKELWKLNKKRNRNYYNNNIMKIRCHKSKIFSPWNYYLYRCCGGI